MFDDADPSSNVLDLDDVAGDEPVDEEDLGAAGLHVEEDPGTIVSGLTPGDPASDDDDDLDADGNEIPPHEVLADPAF
jgi:hypothetical protein